MLRVVDSPTFRSERYEVATLSNREDYYSISFKKNKKNCVQHLGSWMSFGDEGLVDHEKLQIYGGYRVCAAFL